MTPIKRQTPAERQETAKDGHLPRPIAYLSDIAGSVTFVILCGLLIWLS